MPGTGNNSVVAICGERGAGKTTILEQVCHRLGESADLVLPTIRPEFFSANDSVLGLALAHLRRILETRRPDILQKNLSDEATVGVYLNRLLRRASIIGDRDLYDERHRGHSLEEIAEDFVRSASVGSSFAGQWCELASFILRELKNGGVEQAHGRVPALIVSVDDADLAPEVLPRVLVDLRLMTAVPQVICLVCIDLAEARRALSEHYLRNYSHLMGVAGSLGGKGTPIYSVVESQLSKAVPPQWRTTIQELTVDERLKFAPLEATDAAPLLSVLNTFQLSAGGARETQLSELFVLPGTDRASPYAHCLSSNPRDLETLYFQLRNAVNGDPQQVSGMAMRALIEHGLEFGLRNSGDVPAVPSDLAYFDLSSGVAVVRLGLNNIKFYGAGGGEHVILPTQGMPEGSEVAVGELERTSAAYAKGNEDLNNAPKLHQAATNSLLLAREFSYAYSVVHEELGGRAPIRGGPRGSHALRMTVGRDTTDQMHLLYPAWEAYYDYFLVEEGWRFIVDVIKQQAQNWIEHKAPMAAITLEWWRLLAHVQADRRLPPSLGDIVRSIGHEGAGSTRVAARHLDEVWRQLEDVYTRELSRNEGRARDFVQWVESLLLFVCHPAIHDDWFTEFIIDRRELLLKRRGRLSVGNARFVSAMSSRLRRITEEPWIEPLIALIKRFDWEAGAEIERLHIAVTEERARNLTTRFGAYAVGSVRGERDASAPPPRQALFHAAMTALNDLEREARPEGGP